VWDIKSGNEFRANVRTNYIPAPETDFVQGVRIHFDRSEVQITGIK
jgi:hypothetical protein